MRFRSCLAALTALVLSACASTPQFRAPSVTPGPVGNLPPTTLPVPLEGRIAEFASLPGWREDSHAEALAAFKVTCAASRDPGVQQVCRTAKALGPMSDEQARQFFETNFMAVQVGQEGVLTAYFAPEYDARSSPNGEFTAPLRARPSDLVTVDAGVFEPYLAGSPGAGRNIAGVMTPYPDRSEIERERPEKVLAWMRPEDLFFLQIQGSGVLTFENGARMKATYAANNGRRFIGIANALRDRGHLAPDAVSGEAIRAWLAAHRGPEADEIMRLNPRYVFFNLAPDDGRQPSGAAGVPLPPGRAIAVDPSRHAMGEIFWIDAAAPSLSGAFPAYRRLAMALDTGGAIRGEVRADLYMGLGPEAGAEAGRVRHTLRMYRLVPRQAPSS